MTDLTSVQLLQKLISFDSTSRNSNLPLIDFVQQYLEDHGIKSRRVDYEKDNKTNLYATIGPDIEGGIVLSGHTDVVPVDGQDWSNDPFDMVERDGRLFGRGACDMKGFIAVALAAVPKFKNGNLKTPIHLAFSCDEEVGCAGVRPLIDHIIDELPHPGAVIVGEPTSMQVVNGHKSANRFRTTITGHEAHSSCTHLGVSAILTAGEMLSEIGRIAEDYRRRGDPSGRFDPPYTTVQVGMIEGGTANNIIPGHCNIDWESRMLPNHQVEELTERIEAFGKTLEPAMKAISPDAGIKTTLENSIPGLAPHEGSPLEVLTLNLAQANSTSAVSYGTEAGLFQLAGIPAIVCGPGSIEQA
ncbi:MAG TPA: acetylornithine deacetylase, partial [Rhizobiales bacterium]|nr:acetylornithine deacetylase [Hyphomicrobiales bacterium]